MTGVSLERHVADKIQRQQCQSNSKHYYSRCAERRWAAETEPGRAGGRRRVGQVYISTAVASTHHYHHHCLQ